MDIAARSLHVKRDILKRLLDEGLYPYTKRYLGSFDNHFSTIGLVGMNECCLNANWLREDLTHPAAQQFTKEVLNHMRERLADYQELYPGELYNFEATPAESTTYRFAKHDLQRYPDIITAGGKNGDAPYYTNSSHLPVGYTEDMFEALDIQDELQTLYTSGTVFHGFLGEKLPSWESAASLVRKIAENYKLPYYTLSPTYSVCQDHGYITGEHFTCPTCGKPAEVYSRITGYYRPVQNWNDGKIQEFKERRIYDLDAVRKEKQAQEEQEKIYLFTTKTCPNCPVAKNMLDEAHIAYTPIAAEEQPELARRYNIRQAPSLVIADGDAYMSYCGVEEIRKFIEINIPAARKNA